MFFSKPCWTTVSDENYLLSPDLFLLYCSAEVPPQNGSEKHLKSLLNVYAVTLFVHDLKEKVFLILTLLILIEARAKDNRRSIWHGNPSSSPLKGGVCRCEQLRITWKDVLLCILLCEWLSHYFQLLFFPQLPSIWWFTGSICALKQCFLKVSLSLPL